jgi:hypothetical protein
MRFSIERNRTKLPLFRNDYSTRHDVGVTGGGRLFWGVFAPTSYIGSGTLRGNYVGASGNASQGLGLGANVLVGGSNHTISLQPLPVEGHVGINLALGVTGLRLP